MQTDDLDAAHDAFAEVCSEEIASVCRWCVSSGVSSMRLSAMELSAIEVAVVENLGISVLRDNLCLHFSKA